MDDLGVWLPDVPCGDPGGDVSPAARRQRNTPCADPICINNLAKESLSRPSGGARSAARSALSICFDTLRWLHAHFI
eukprot:4816947-Prymnesium_polylepis.2